MLTRSVTKLIAVVLLVGCGGGSKGALADRQAEVERRGQAVMPFDQDRTLHHFRKTPGGGVQTVVNKGTRDPAQVALIRSHLRAEAGRFARGDFTDPMRIHGMTMPGVAALRRGAAAGGVSVTYSAVADGARITYETDDPTLVEALHTWFDAQLMDHGSHATT